MGDFIILVRDGMTYGIPSDPDNGHYQQYLAWVAEGNEPEIVNVP
jgi:hypothetical protein